MSKANSKAAEELANVLDIAQAAALLGVGTERVKQFLREGRLLGRRQVGAWIVSRSAAEELAQLERPAGWRPGRARKRPPAKKRAPKKNSGKRR